jgi:hypothetical protein
LGPLIERFENGDLMLPRNEGSGAWAWFTGYNSNVPGHEHGKTRYLVYNGGTPKYVAAINEVAAKGYEGIVFSEDRRSEVGYWPKTSTMR